MSKQCFVFRSAEDLVKMVTELEMERHYIRLVTRETLNLESIYSMGSFIFFLNV